MYLLLKIAEKLYICYYFTQEPRCNMTLAEKTAENLMQLIQEQRLGPGDKLPTEAVLTKELNIGRNTLREAQRILASRNIITVRQGSGSFISANPGISDDPLGFSMVQDKKRLTEDLLQVRIMLEPGISALAAQNRTDKDLNELEKILNRIEALINARENFRKEDVQFHGKIADCTHNMVMSELIPVITGGVEIFAVTVSDTEYEQTLRSHRLIFDAIREQRAYDAENAMRYHLLFNQNRFEYGGKL